MIIAVLDVVRMKSFIHQPVCKTDNECEMFFSSTPLRLVKHCVLLLLLLCVLHPGKAATLPYYDRTSIAVFLIAATAQSSSSLLL